MVAHPEKNSSFIIRLERLRFFAFIGVLPEEQVVGNDFIVDCEFETSAEYFVSELLESTVSYADVYAVIEEIMSRKWKLLESVAMEIGERCINKWPQIRRIAVKVKKVNPPIPGIQGSSSVEYRNSPL